MSEVLGKVPGVRIGVLSVFEVRVMRIILRITRSVSKEGPCTSVSRGEKEWMLV